MSVFLLRGSHVSPVLPQRAGRSRLYAEGKGEETAVYQKDEKFRLEGRLELACVARLVEPCRSQNVVVDRGSGFLF